MQCAIRKSNSAFYCSTPLKAICNDSYRFEMSMLHKFFINLKMFKSQKINSLLMVCPTRSSREYRYATLQPLCYIFSGIFFLFQTLMYYSLFTVHWDTPLGHVAACCLAMHCFLPSFQFPQFTLLCSYCVQFVPHITNYASQKPEVCYSVNEDEWSSMKHNRQHQKDWGCFITLQL